jgi:hypothetical protein
MTGGALSAVPVRFWRVRGEGCFPSALARPCQRKRPNKARGPYRRAVRTDRSEAATLGMRCKVVAGSALGRWPNPYQASVVKRADRCIAGAGWPSE